MKTKTTKRLKTKKRVPAGPLDFLIKYWAAHPTVGLITHLANRLSKRTGTSMFRQQVQAWLRRDPKKRIEPKLTVGLMLIEEGHKFIGNGKARK
jgi:hypothetical protein